MSGLIWSGIGQGIANAGSTLGGYMMQSAMQDDRQEERRREKEEEARRQAERDALYRRTADQQAAGKGGGGTDGGMTAADIGEGGKDEGLLARSMGMTVPELRAMRKFSETGDTEPFKRGVERYKDEVTSGDTTDAVSRKYAKQMNLTEVVKELPAGFEREARAKLQTLAKIEESYRLGKDYKEVAEGRRTQQEVDASQAAMANPEAAGRIGQGMAAGGGKALVGGDSNVTRNLFTGATSTTPVGQSVITKNTADSNQSGASVREAPQERLTAEAETLRKAANEAVGERKRALEAKLDEVLAELQRRRAASKPTPAPAPGAARPPAAPASGVTRGGSRWTLQPS
jgi:hypothetical protein